ncbi:MAG: transcriptional repressor [Anaerolineae bacterium]|nr:transcriptional repressor [Anaerolineae bacterium]
MRSSSVVQAILDVLGDKDTHLTSREIFDCIHERLPAVNPSTVYRALERLTQEGVVSISDLGIGSMVYELVTGKNHHHLVCQQCRSIVTIEGQEIDLFFSNIQAASGYRLVTNHLVLFGVCPACRQKMLENKAA